MTAIVSPLPQFFDLDGSPLSSGYLYFGTANGNPETSPITVYWDAAMTQPAAQPLRTSAGAIVRGGTAANVYVGSLYSLTVRNSSGQQVLYSATSEGYESVAALIFSLATAGTSTGAAQVGYLPAGTGAVPRTMQDKARDTISVFDFFPSAAEVDAVRAGTSTLDSTPYILLAANYAAPKDIDVVFPGGTLLMKSTLALTTAHHNLTFRLQGATIKKAFNGTLVTVTGTSAFSVDGAGVINGDGATYTGKGFAFSGTGSHRPYFGPGILTTGFADNHFYFAATSGFQAVILCSMTAYSGQTSNQAVLIDGPDAQACMRTFEGVIIGHITLTGALATIIRCPIINRVETDAASDVVIVSGVSWSNNNLAMTLNAGAMIVTGCRFSGDVTLSSAMSGSFTGNVQTFGTFTNSTVGGNALVHHHETSASYSKLAKHSYSVSLTQSEMQLNQITSMSDADDTWTPDTTATVRYLAVNLTANRTVTLTTAGARAGMVARFSRPGGNTAGPWNLVLGATGYVLLTKQWADVMFNGSAWVCTAHGTLP